MFNADLDVLIIGAGPSGCVAAAYLHEQGLTVKVVEKSKFPRFVIGESLLPRCMDHFKEVGFLDVLNAQNYEIKRGARFIRRDVVCHFDFSQKFSDGFDWTWQVPRADFDNVLAQELINRGVEVAFEEEVIEVQFDAEGHSETTIRTSQNKTYVVKAKFIVDSSGFGRVLPRLLNLEKPSEIPEHSSIFTHVDDQNRPDGIEGTLITFDIFDNDTWFWVIPFSNGVTSIGFVGKTDYLNSFEGSPTEQIQQLLKLSHHYYERFKDVSFKFEPMVIQNYSKSVTKLYGHGFVLTGNSAEFLDPVFSSGVTFATESALKAAKLITQKLNGHQVNWERDYADYMKEGVSVFASYVKEWYTGNLQTIFFEGNTNPEIKQQICSVLAGYVWDTENPFVSKHNRLIKTLAQIIKLEKSAEKH